MDKKQAADYLGISTRTLERYVSEGKIQATLEPGKTRPTLSFNQSDLDRFKEGYQTAIVKPVKIDKVTKPEPPPMLLDMPVPTTDKLLLTIPEISKLTGLSKDFIRSEIYYERLHAKKIKGRWFSSSQYVADWVKSLLA